MPDDTFKNRIRLRVNGIFQEAASILLVQLRSPVNDALIWMPPGGGLQFGETMKEGLQREFLEETGLEIEVGELAFINELVEPPFHAVECYFFVQRTGGALLMGADPELPDDEQLLKDLQWVPVDKLDRIHLVPEQLPLFLE
jgi:8-oxo-dGTP diphosphatase